MSQLLCFASVVAPTDGQLGKARLPRATRVDEALHHRRVVGKSDQAIPQASGKLSGLRSGGCDSDGKLWKALEDLCPMGGEESSLPGDLPPAGQFADLLDGLGQPRGAFGVGGKRGAGDVFVEQLSRAKAEHEAPSRHLGHRAGRLS